MTTTEIQTAAESAVARFLADFDRSETDRLEAGRASGQAEAWRALRKRGIERFAALGFPTSQQEEWRQTSLSPLAKLTFLPPATDPEAMTEEQVAPFLFPAAATLVFVDGRMSRRLSRTEGLPPGAVAASLADALAQGVAGAVDHLGAHASLDQPFVALNSALFEDGAYIEIPRGVAVEGTIHLLFLSSSADGRPTRSFPRTLVVAGESSRVSLVETFAGTGGYFCCPVTELACGPNSVVDHYKVQRESREAFHVATFQLHGERSATPSSHSISLGGQLVRNDVNAVLDGEGIDCILNGLYLVEEKQHVDNHMRVEHAKPHCASHELYKGILDGKARAVFNGLIHVHPGAQKTDAKQSNRNLLLSRDAIANSNPQLEIYADDVKCTHGSTVGQLDDDAVFYLRSRGIGEEAARSLLTYAFASDIVERIRVEPVRKDLEEFLFARLPKGEVVRQAV
jgi:Fe-S cluster assembly protein SufD